MYQFEGRIVCWWSIDIARVSYRRNYEKPLMTSYNKTVVPFTHIKLIIQTLATLIDPKTL